METNAIISLEPNDIIPFAEEIELYSSSTITISGEIGDKRAPLLDERDVDLFEVELDQGDTLLADINAAINGSSLNSVLTIFDANGNLLVQNDDNSYEGENGNIETEHDSFQQFTATQDGTYYIGVSSSANLNYNPNVPLSGIGNSSGDYDLVLTLNEGLGAEGTSDMTDVI